MLSFEVLHVEIAQKLQNLEFCSFLAIFDRFSIFANFFVIIGKIVLKRNQMSWN